MKYYVKFVGTHDNLPLKCASVQETETHYIFKAEDGSVVAKFAHGIVSGYWKEEPE